MSQEDGVDECCSAHLFATLRTYFFNAACHGRGNGTPARLSDAISMTEYFNRTAGRRMELIGAPITFEVSNPANRAASQASS